MAAFAEEAGAGRAERPGAVRSRTYGHGVPGHIGRHRVTVAEHGWLTQHPAVISATSAVNSTRRRAPLCACLPLVPDHVKARSATGHPFRAFVTLLSHPASGGTYGVGDPG